VLHWRTPAKRSKKTKRLDTSEQKPELEQVRMHTNISPDVLHIISPAIRKLENEGWEREEHDGFKSLILIIMTEQYAGASFIVHVDTWESEDCEVFITDFNKDDSTTKSDESDAFCHEGFKTSIAKLSDMIAPYKRRAYDVEGELEALQEAAEEAECDRMAEELMSDT
jgi:hypothetical protein